MTMLIDAEPLPEYPDPYGLLLAILHDGTNEWRLEMDPKLPDEAVVWQPYPGMHSIGAIMLHIILVEIFWFEHFALDLPHDPDEMEMLLAEETNVDEWQWPVPHHKPISWYFEWHDRVRARTHENIKKWPAPDFSKNLHGRPRTMRWVLGHVIQHEAYHGGQAVLLNRLWQLRDSH